MSNDLDTIAQPRNIVAAHTQATAVEQARAVAEVAAAVRVAQENPRDEARAVSRMRQTCGQQALADRAFYSVPRAGGRVEGSSVHLARSLASCWGNIDYGIRELKRDDEAGESEMQAWAWDQEANVRSSRSFVVPHARMVGSAKRGDKRRERLTDLGDIVNNNNSQAARAVRETIFTVLPVWFTAEAEAICTATLNGAGAGKPLSAQVADALAHYADTYGVTKAQLEAHTGLSTADWTAQTLGGLRVLSGELGRGEKQVRDEFPSEQPAAASKAVTADDLTAATPEKPAEDDPTLDPEWGQK